MNGTSKTLVILSVLIAAVIAAMLIWRGGNQSAEKGYKGQGGKGARETMWNNLANIVDAGGRVITSSATAISNGVVAVIATKKNNGKAVMSEYGYSDEKPDYGPYIIGGAVVLAAVVVAAVSISKR